MKKIWFSALLLLGLASFATVYAADIVGPSQGDPNVNISQNQEHHNLYTSGSSVTARGKTTGDLVAAGGTLNLEGPVEQDVLAAGGTLSISGQVGGDVRAAGGNVTINSAVGGDVLAAGGNVVIYDTSSVGGDAILAGGNVAIKAPVKGYVKIMAGSVSINSKIEGNVTVDASKGLSFGPNAEVTGSIVYRGPNQAAVDPAAKISAIQYTKVNYHSWGGRAAGILTLAFLVQLLAWIFAGLLVMRFAKSSFYTVHHTLQTSPWASFGLGLAGLVGIPLLAILLFFVLVGYYVAIFLLVGFAFMLLVAGIFAALSLGALIVRWLTKSAETPDWQIVVIGVVVWQLLKFVPVAGWAIMFILGAMVFGAMLFKGRHVFEKK